MFGMTKTVVNGSLGRLYVVYDSVAEQSAGIFECENDAVAARYFRRGMSEAPRSEYDDFKLLCIGTYDHKSCELVSFKENIKIDVPYIEEIKKNA